MRCPKCGYVSFEYLDSCKKCSKDLFEFKEKAGISLLEPAYLNLNQFIEGGASEEVSGGTSGEMEDMEFNDETGIMEDISEESVPSKAENLLDSLDMGEENDMGLGLEADEEEGADLTGDVEDLDVSLGASEEEGSITMGAEENGEISMDLSTEGEEISLAQEDEGEIDLTNGAEDMNLSLSTEEEGSIAMGTEEDGEISLDLSTEDEEISLEEAPELEIDLEEETVSSDKSGEDEISFTGSEEGIDFSIKMEEDSGSSDEESQEGADDIEGEIELMLEGLDDTEPKDS